MVLSFFWALKELKWVQRVRVLFINTSRTRKISLKMFNGLQFSALPQEGAADQSWRWRHLSAAGIPVIFAHFIIRAAEIDSFRTHTARRKRLWLLYTSAVHVRACMFPADNRSSGRLNWCWGPNRSRGSEGSVSGVTLRCKKQLHFHWVLHPHVSHTNNTASNDQPGITVDKSW